MVKRFIWDLDGTILDVDFSKEEELFKRNLSEEDFLKFNALCSDLIKAYEKKYLKYDKKLLSKFLSESSGVLISEKLIEKWIDYMIDTNLFIKEGVVEVLEYLNNLGIENVIYSNWFTKTQIGRLKKVGLDSYFKEIIGGDYYIKPNKEGFLYACGSYKPSECVMVGDSYENDILGALNTGLKVIYYCPNDEVSVPHIKKLNEIKEMY